MCVSDRLTISTSRHTLSLSQGRDSPRVMSEDEERWKLRNGENDRAILRLLGGLALEPERRGRGLRDIATNPDPLCTPQPEVTVDGRERGGAWGKWERSRAQLP